MRPEDVLCNYCGAKPGQPCSYGTGDKRKTPHQERTREAKMKDAPKDVNQIAAKLVQTTVRESEK
jgi:hypothetical protein